MSCGEIQVKSNLLNYWHFFLLCKSITQFLNQKQREYVLAPHKPYIFRVYFLQPR